MAESSTYVSILGFLEIIMIGVCGYYLGQLVGNNDSNNDLTKTLLPVTGALSGIVLLHTLLWYYYFTYNPLGMNLYFMVATAFSMVISLTALSVALITKG